MRSCLTLTGLLSLVLATAAVPSFATPVTSNIAITNADFSNPVLDPGAVLPGVPGWTALQTDSSAQNGFAAVSREGVLTTVGGPNFALVNNFNNVTTGISQQLTATVQNDTTYDLSAYFGWRYDNIESIGGLQIWAGGVATGGSVAGGTLLDSVLVTPTRGTFAQGNLVFTTSDNESTAGELLSIVVTGEPIANAFAQTEFDDVALTATVNVPEPGTMAVLGIAMAGTAFVRRKRGAGR